MITSQPRGRFQEATLIPSSQHGPQGRSRKTVTMAFNDQHTAQAHCFGAASVRYDSGRPTYPQDAVDWLLPVGARKVLDLGAGTGKLTGLLVGRDLDVVAVEPSDGMREQFARALPGVRVLAGSAERIPLADNAVDTVLVAQAWHWVDVERAVPEIARVLSPGGRLGLVWNIRNEREDWVAQLGQIMHPGIEQDMRSASSRVGAPFGPVQRFDLEWTYHFTPNDLCDLVASRSYVITLAANERQVLDAKVRQLVKTHPALAGEQDIQMPYIARCSRATLV